MRLEHVGIAIRDPEAAAVQLRRVLGLAAHRVEPVPSERIVTHFYSGGSAQLELLESLDEHSAVGRFLAKRGQGYHHLAFEVDDLVVEMDRLRRAGVELLQMVPTRGADGKLIFFVHPRETPGILVEFCQTAAPPVARWEVSDLGEPWLQAGSPVAPPLLLSTSRPEFPDSPLPAELAKHFLVIRPAAPWSYDSARALSDHLRASPRAFRVTLDVSSALSSGISALQTYADRLGLLVELGPLRGSPLPPTMPRLVVGRPGTEGVAQRESTTPDGPNWTFSVTEDVFLLGAREPGLVADLVLHAERSMRNRSSPPA